MDQQFSTFKIGVYLREHWFKIILAAIVIFVFFKKDFSVNLNLNSPDKMEFKNDTPLDKKKSTKRVTQKINVKEKGIMDKFSFGSIFFSDKKKKKALELDRLEEDVKLAYLKRFGHVAVKEKKKFGIPASVILANGLMHSEAGKSEVSREGNNHFNIPCSINWRGAEGKYDGKCYRGYESAWMSYRDHSKFITSGNYSELKSLGDWDYKAWAKALEEKEFSDFKQYAKQMIKIIEKYDLQQFDQE